MIKNRIRTTVASVFAAAALAVSASIAGSGPAQAAPDPGRVQATGGTYAGCPYGAVCIYPGTSWNGGNPEHVYWSYGAHKLYNEYGTHRIFNNQSGGATAAPCRTSSGTNCDRKLAPWRYRHVNLTPMNSIRLYP